jgi:CRISPR system Cascade subunit CasC
MPRGKQNSFAGHAPAYAALVTIREDRPLNFVGAFEKPIAASDDGFARRATQELAVYADNVYRSFAKKPLRAYVVALDDAAEFFTKQKNPDGSACEQVNLEELLQALASEVQTRFGGVQDARPAPAE